MSCLESLTAKRSLRPLKGILDFYQMHCQKGERCGEIVEHTETENLKFHPSAEEMGIERVRDRPFDFIKAIAKEYKMKAEILVSP